MRHFQLAALLACGIATTGCAVTSGLQTYDLPSEGVFQTDLGTKVNVIKLTQDSMMAVQPAVQNIQQQYAHLFNTQHRNYNLSPGDILSIYLWAYPELTSLAIVLVMIKLLRPVASKSIQKVIFSFPLLAVIRPLGNH